MGLRPSRMHFSISSRKSKLLAMFYFDYIVFIFRILQTCTSLTKTRDSQNVLNKINIVLIEINMNKLRTNLVFIPPRSIANVPVYFCFSVCIIIGKHNSGLLSLSAIEKLQSSVWKLTYHI